MTYRWTARTLYVVTLVGAAYGCGVARPGGASVVPQTGGTTPATAATAVTSQSTTPTAQGNLTYYKDTKPIIDAMCSGCHSAGNIAPFTLTSYADVQSQLGPIQAAVSNNIMPPWPAGPNCNSYKYETSLSDAQKATLLDWAAAGGAAGDPSTATTTTPLAVGDMPRVDVTLKMPQPYRVQEVPDEYRCFILDWPTTTTKYVTGFRVHPDNRAVVHHAIMMIAMPNEVATITQKDGADGKPGYACPGSFGVTSIIPHWLGFWAPGNNGDVFSSDESTGLPVQAGSKIVMQMHYHWEGDPNKALPDQSSLDIMWKDSVPKPGAVVEVVGLQWFLDPSSMKIPAGDADAEQSANLSMSTIWSLFSGNAAAGTKYKLYSGGIHMHQLGSKGTLSLTSGGAEDCLVDIPQWNFHWQDTFVFQTPVEISPNDTLKIDCHWDNSAANQPVINGVKNAPANVQWGEGTNDEMCLGIMYIAPE